MGESSSEKATSARMNDGAVPPNAAGRSGFPTNSEKMNRFTAIVTMLMIMFLNVSRCL